VNGNERGIQRRPVARVSLVTIVGQWLRLGCIGFGGPPPTHIALLPRMCVEERRWMETRGRGCHRDHEPSAGPSLDAVGDLLCLAVAGGGWRGPGWALFHCSGARAHPCTVGGLPGWLSTGLGSWCGGRRRRGGARRGTERGVGTGPGQLETNRHRASSAGPLGRLRHVGSCRCDHGRPLPSPGASRLRADRDHRSSPGPISSGSAPEVIPAVVLHMAAVGGLGALAWVALKVGALSYSGGLVIIPLIQHDAVTTYHWMTGTQFLNAVALGQITPGPVVQTVAVVGYAAGGVGGGLLAALIAFAPSFAFVLLGGSRFDQIRGNSAVESFLTGAGPAVTGAIAGSAIPLGLAFQHLWQIPVLAGALLWLFVIRRGVVSGLLVAGVIGAVVALTGLPA